MDKMAERTKEFIFWIQDPGGANMKLATMGTDESGRVVFYKFVGAIAVIVECFEEHGFSTYVVGGPQGIEETKRFLLDKIAGMRGEGPTPATTD